MGYKERIRWKFLKSVTFNTKLQNETDIGLPVFKNIIS